MDKELTIEISHRLLCKILIDMQDAHERLENGKNSLTESIVMLSEKLRIDVKWKKDDSNG